MTTTTFLNIPAGHTTQFVHTDDGKHVIGRVSRVARNRFKWVRYVKPVAITTKAKNEPKVAETHTVSRMSTGVWAVKHSYECALGGTNG